MHPSSLSQRPSRPVPIHAFSPSDRDDRLSRAIVGAAGPGATPGPRAAARTPSQAKPMDEPLSDWQVFTLLGGTAGGFLSLGIAALYGLSLLLP